MGSLLEVKNLTKIFGGLKALTDVTFNVAKGQCFGLIGPNGAGKTTFFNVLTGVYSATQGDIMLNGQSIIGLKPHEIIGKGFGRTFQKVRLFPNLSVTQNVRLGQHLQADQGVIGAILSLKARRETEKNFAKQTRELLGLVGIEQLGDELARNLSFGQQKKLELARALATNPSILLLDEPAAGLTGQERSELIDRIGQLRGKGMTIILVEHDMDVVLGVTDQIAVLDFGQKIFEGTPEEIQRSEVVIAAYLGEEPVSAHT